MGGLFLLYEIILAKNRIILTRKVDHPATATYMAQWEKKPEIGA